MGLIIGTLVVLGGSFIIGGIINAATEDDRARARIAQLEAENKQLSAAKDYVSDIKSKLTTAKSYLNDGKNDFKNGGHVLDNVPLANPEFTSCIEDLDGAIRNANYLIEDFKDTISENKNEIRKEKAKLD